MQKNTSTSPSVKSPLSPHLQVYNLPFAARLSIFHRFTGAALSVGLVLLSLSLFALARGESAWSMFHGFYAHWFGQLVLIGFTFALMYHLLNGIRHLNWDLGKGLELNEARRSGQFVVIGAIALTVFAWVLAWSLN